MVECWQFYTVQSIDVNDLKNLNDTAIIKPFHSDLLFMCSVPLHLYQKKKAGNKLMCNQLRLHIGCKRVGHD